MPGNQHFSSLSTFARARALTQAITGVADESPFYNRRLELPQLPESVKPKRFLISRHTFYGKYLAIGGFSGFQYVAFGETCTLRDLRLFMDGNWNTVFGQLPVRAVYSGHLVPTRARRFFRRGYMMLTFDKP